MNKMRNYIAFGFIFFALFLLSCDKEQVEEIGESKLNMDVKFIFGEEAFNINQVYAYYPLDYDLKIENLKLYLAEMSLVDVDDVRHPLSEILFVNAAETTNTFTFTIPALQYKSIEYSIGVPSNLNGTDNPDFDAALYDPYHPLSLSNGMYWTWNTGYRFVLIDGRCNTNPDIDDEFETLVSIHTGKDYCYRSKSVPFELNAVNGAADEFTLYVDVHGFFSTIDDTIDLAIDNQSHGTNEPLANRVSDNVKLSVYPWN